MKRAAIYVRVSTDRQTVENQIRALTEIAERRGWQIVAKYDDAGISGAKAGTSASASIPCSRMLSGASSM